MLVVMTYAVYRPDDYRSADLIGHVDREQDGTWSARHLSRASEGGFKTEHDAALWLRKKAAEYDNDNHSN